MDNAVKSSARVLPRSPNICRRRWSHFIRAQIFDLCIHVLFARIMHHAIGYIHPTMYFHAHICDGLFQIQIGKWIHNRKELTDNADTQRFRRFIQRRVAEYLLYFPIDAVNILSGRYALCLPQELLICFFIRTGRVKPAVLIILIRHFINVFQQLERIHCSGDDTRILYFRIDTLEDFQ